MSSISAVICELNPAHSGHEYIFSKAREQSDVVIAVQSGNFVQRGEAAVYHKYKRAQLALETGADLAVELPFPWSASSAEYFARAGVRLAEGLGADRLVFGSESGDASALMRAAEILKSEEFSSALPPGRRAAEERERMLYERDGSLPRGILSSRNDILAVEYCKNAKKIISCPYKRISTVSASDLRREMFSGTPGEDVFYSSLLFDLEFSHFRLMRDKNLTSAESAGGVGERLRRAAYLSRSGEEMLAAAATKQYTNARLRRAALFSMLGVKTSQMRAYPRFTTVLAANKAGRSYLASLRNKTDIIILTKPSDGYFLHGTAREQFELSAFADSVFALCRPTPLPGDYFIKMSPVISD